VHGPVAQVGTDLEGNSGGLQLRQLNPLRVPSGFGFVQDQADIGAGGVLPDQGVRERG
jgi:hypothetical protein